MKSAALSSLFATILVFIGLSTITHATPLKNNLNPDSVKAQLVRDWERAKEYTRAYINAMPEDGVGFKPTPEIRSFAEQMLHLAQGTINLVGNGVGTPSPYPGKNLEKTEEFKTKAALLKVVMDSYDYAIDGVKNLDVSKYDERVKKGPFDLPRLTWIMKGFEHQTHHRGQCTIYLRLKGVTPPNEQLF